jgi:hypothetical protein
VASPRLLLAFLLLAAVAFAVSFAIARALRDEPRSGPAAPPAMMEMEPLAPARLPPMLPQATGAGQP